MEPLLGYLPDWEDKRDFPFATLAATLESAVPDRASIRDLLGAPFDQGRLGSCVAQATAKALRASHARQGYHNVKPASRLAIYYLARATHKSQHFDSGTFIRAAFQILNVFGFAAEESWAYDAERFAQMPPDIIFQKGIDQSDAASPTSYYRIWEEGTERTLAVRRAISAGYAVVFGADVGSVFTGDAFDPDDLVDPRSGERKGGHAMVLGAYDERGAYLLNSWGASWGKAGWAHVPWEFIAEGIRDVWVVEHAPPYSDDIYEELDS